MKAPQHGVGFDLELDGRNHLRDVGAIGGEGEFRRQNPADPAAALRDLDDFAARGSFVYGHNIYWHDLPWLRKANPRLALLQQPAVDTLVLSSIAFAEHPYHHLVKDYKLVRAASSDPVADSRLAATLLQDASQRLHQIAAANPLFLRVVRSLAERGLTAISPAAAAGARHFFGDISGPSPDLDGDLTTLLAGRACHRALRGLLPIAAQPAETVLALLFVVAWLRVAGSHDTASQSVVMPWVRRQLPAVTSLLHQLRDVPCDEASCRWCVAVHDPVRQLQRWFQHPDFRPQPTLVGSTLPAQRAIVEAGFRNEPLLALLPTGGGKSLCFQLPAINRYLRRGHLTIVISPLQSLMHDQVDNFAQKTGAPLARALTGRLSLPERREVLDAVSSGQVGLLYVAPEQLRNSTFKKVIAMREIGAWVFDEAHCLSKWGHDFRPDYLYAARFVHEFSDQQQVPAAPIVCVTATAIPEVRVEIVEHFQRELGQRLQEFDGHAPRENLTLRVEVTEAVAKVARLRELVAETLARSLTGSVLVYTATRSNAEKTAQLLRQTGIAAEAFHAGLTPTDKKDVQGRFLSGQLRVVCATNAFGMGIDKSDLRLVVHFEIPGSLEAYVQEVGRAGRDGLPAEAVLLFAPADIETQFRLAANSRLDQQDLQGILRRIRHLARLPKQHEEAEAICTTGEILRDDAVAERIDPNDRGAPTRVITAIAWLERGRFLRRDENATAMFQGRPRVQNCEEARQRIEAIPLPPHKAKAWLQILERLINAEADAGLSSDDFLDLPGRLGAVTTTHAEAGRIVLSTLGEMQKAGLLTSGVLLTAFLRHGVAEASTTVLDQSARLEARMLDLLRATAPDVEAGRGYPLSVRELTRQVLEGHADSTPTRVRHVLSAMADRSQEARPTAPGLRLQFTSHDHCLVTVSGTWDQIVDTAQRRHHLASLCLQRMLTNLLSNQPKGQARGGSLLAEFTLDELQQDMAQDLVLRSAPSRDPVAELEYALLFLHRIEAIVLHKGLAVFRQAMVLRVPRELPRRPFTKEDFQGLAEHQDERTVQIHIMHEFAQRQAASPTEGLTLLDDYFRLPRDVFLSRHFKGRREQLGRATGQDSWRRIVAELNRSQRQIVESALTKSALVLAGPGSGKTRVVVHRCAYLLRVKRVPARSILVLCFNRSAAIELRHRLQALVGDDARGVLVQTYHGMALRLVGRSPVELLEDGEALDEAFRKLMRQAAAMLVSGGIASGEAAGDTAPDDVRDRLLAGFRYILVDEYQDIDAEQYQLVSAIAGRTLLDGDRKLTVLAVGDDDQNIYEFRHANVQFLRQFEQDYDASRFSLVENYRSTAHIIAAANQLIAKNPERLKVGAAIRIDERRQQEPAGGALHTSAHPARGRVQVLEVGPRAGQAIAVRDELQRLRHVVREFDWEHCAVLSPRHWLLDDVRTVLEGAGIPTRRRVDPARSFSLFRLREVQAFLRAVEAEQPELDAARLQELLQALRREFPREQNLDLVERTLAALLVEHGEQALPRSLVREFFGEVLAEQRRERTVGKGVMLSTVHGSKGLEFDHVILLDGGWQPRNNDTPEQLRRLYYVGMTRARQSLTIMQVAGGAAWVRAFAGDAFHRSPASATAGAAEHAHLRYELLGLGGLWLSFAGVDDEHEAIDRAMRALATDDALQLVSRGDRLFLADASGRRLGAFSKKAAADWSTRLEQVVGVRVAAILERRREDEGEEYRDHPRRDSWQLVLPEIVYREVDRG